jgi:hypothetical protein
LLSLFGFILAASGDWLTWVVLPVGWEGIVLGALLLLLHGLGHHGRHARLLPPVHLATSRNSQADHGEGYRNRKRALSQPKGGNATLLPAPPPEQGSLKGLSYEIDFGNVDEN